MKDLAPHIFRKRILVEGFYSIEVTADVVKTYLLSVAAHLSLRTYGEPVVFAPSSGMGRDENSGFDGFVPLIDSGISAYIWSKEKFFSILLYTCKDFQHDDAVSFTADFFKVSGEVAWKQV